MMSVNIPFEDSCFMSYVMGNRGLGLLLAKLCKLESQDKVHIRAML